MYYLPHVRVTKACRQALLDRFPILADRRRGKGHLRLLGYLIFSGYYDKREALTNNRLAVPVPHQIIRLAYDLDQQAKTSDVLARFSQDVFPIEVIDYSWLGKKARRVVLPEGLVDPYLAMNRGDHSAEDTWVRLDTGCPSRTRRITNDQADHAAAIQRTTPLDHPLAVAMAHLNEHHWRWFQPTPEAWAAAEAFAATVTDPQQRRYYQQVLLRLRGHLIEAPLYYPVEASSRIYSQSPLLNMPSALRHRLYPDYLEFDLQNAQLAIAAKFWDIPYLQDLLASGKSVWPLVAEDTGLPLSLYKAKIKQFVYALMYCSGWEKAALEAELSDDEMLRLKEHPVLKHLVQARDRMLKQIRETKHITLPVSGKVIWVSKDRKPPSLLAQYNQEVESTLISPIFLSVSARADYNTKILLFQHDGFTLMVQIRRRTHEFKRLVTHAVDNACYQLGVPSRLVQQQLTAD